MLWKEGVKTLNPALVRESAVMWWYDASARALAAEYRDQTKHLMDSTSVNDTDVSRLLPGDLAVTSDGVHVLSYLGGDAWIEADPGEGKVLTLRTAPESKKLDSWLNLPVTLVRWRILSNE
jgi:hypothetical protein